MTAGSCGNKLLLFFHPEKGTANQASAGILQTTVYTYHLFPCWVMSTFLLPLLALWV